MADISQTAANVILSAGSPTTGALATGVTVTQGQPLVQDTNGSLVLADANVTALQGFIGIALSAGSPLQQITYAPANTKVNIGAVLTPGDVVYVSSTAGRLTKTYGDLTTGAKVIVLGVADADGLLTLDPIIGGIIP